MLKQLKDAKTKNVNVIFDAFQIHSQLWIVNEYCPGGSVRTLVSLVFFGFFDPFSSHLMPYHGPIYFYILCLKHFRSNATERSALRDVTVQYLNR